jgi:endonuclease/exonuclease/phosphatase family metal-dependent hydrolase
MNRHADQAGRSRTDPESQFPSRNAWPPLLNAKGPALALAGLLAVLAQSGGATADAEAPKPFRILTYNIHHGEGLDGRLDLDRIAQVITNARADIVCLNEVDQGVTRTQKRDLPAELAARTGLTCLFSNNYHFQGGQYGNAILTRFPVLGWTNTHLRMLRTGEQRGLLQARLRVQGRELVFMATHIDYRRDDAERMLNLEQFFELLPGYAGTPVVITGDFNDFPGKRVHARMSERFRDAWMEGGGGDGFTIPANQPTERIDYVWLEKGAPLKVRQVQVLSTEASDHRPVCVELEWR